ncbi:transposase [Streptomyces sp. NBC_01187]|uniref:transposase n=1 Tax=Streptomyces sp. NBC_01187 TaxID=2903766 RepID=UPI0038635C83
MIAVVLIVRDDVRPDVWAHELEEVLLRVGHRFDRVDLRRRMRDYVRGPLGPVGRKNGWQLAEYVGHDVPAGLQNLLNRARWDPDEIRDDLQEYVAERLGEPDGVLIIDETGFLKKGTTSAGCNGSTRARQDAQKTARSQCSRPMPRRGAGTWSPGHWPRRCPSRG